MAEGKQVKMVGRLGGQLQMLEPGEFREALDVLQNAIGGMVITQGQIIPDGKNKEVRLKNFNTPDDPDGVNTYAYLKKLPEHGWVIIASTL